MRGAFVALIATLLMLGTSPSQAHRISTRSGPSPVGVSIPSLTHGQMAVIRDNLPAIRALASGRLRFDMTTWRLEDYLNLQSFACLWGVAFVERTVLIHNATGDGIPFHPPTAMLAAAACVAISVAAWGAWPRRSMRREPRRADV